MRVYKKDDEAKLKSAIEAITDDEIQEAFKTLRSFTATEVRDYLADKIAKETGIEIENKPSLYVLIDNKITMKRYESYTALLERLSQRVRRVIDISLQEQCIAPSSSITKAKYKVTDNFYVIETKRTQQNKRAREAATTGNTALSRKKSKVDTETGRTTFDSSVAFAHYKNMTENLSKAKQLYSSITQTLPLFAESNRSVEELKQQCDNLLSLKQYILKVSKMVEEFEKSMQQTGPQFMLEHNNADSLPLPNTSTQNTGSASNVQVNATVALTLIPSFSQVRLFAGTSQTKTIDEQAHINEGPNL